MLLPEHYTNPSFNTHRFNKSLIIKIMAIINSLSIIKLLVILMNKENVIRIIKENTYKPEVIPTLITRFSLTIFLEMSKDLPHDLEKKTATLSNEYNTSKFAT